MASRFPITFAAGHGYPDVRMQPVFLGETFVAGDLVFHDASAGAGVKLCAANPALILGIAMTGALDAAMLHPASLIPVAILTPEIVCLMSSATAPTQALMFGAYDIVRTAAGLWQLVNTSANARVDAVDYSPHTGVFGQEVWHAKFKAANLQGDAIAS